MKIECKNCFFFVPLRSSGYGYVPACCKHPDCYEKKRVINCFGEPDIIEERTKDIKDFNLYESCSKFTPFKMEKRKWWILTYEEKVPVIGEKDDPKV